MSFKDSFDSGASTESKFLDFKPKEGSNSIRVMDDPTVIVKRFENKKFVGVCFEGAPYCANLDEGQRLDKKWKAWVLDRADGLLKTYDMPYTVAKEIRAYMDNPEYNFKTFPMPFDITISVTNAGTFDAEYSVLPSRKDTPLTEDEIAAYKKKVPASELVQKAKENAKKKYDDENAVQLEEPQTEKDTPNPDDIPF